MDLILKQFNFIFEIVAKFILTVFGWNEIKISSMLPERSVIVAQSTSKWDMFFLLLYKYAYNDKFKKHLLITDNSIFNQLPSKIKNYSNEIIPIINNSDEIINNICDKIIKNKVNNIIITPFNGNSYTKEFYEIAKILNVPIIVAGLDYEEKRLKIFEPIHFDYDNETEKDIIKEIKNSLKNIIPLNTKEINLEYRSHKKDEISVTNNYFFILIISTIAIIIIYFIYKYGLIRYTEKIRNWIM
jgi:hypothetical protein